MLAIGLASILLSGALGLVTIANRTSAEGLRRQSVLWDAQEGMGALDSMTFDDLILTEAGSLAFALNQWTLTDTGPDVLEGGLTRTIKVQSVERDGNCALVGSGGTVDPDSLYLESSVAWTDLAGNPQTVTLRKLRTNWQNPQGSCFAGGDADCVSISTGTAAWYGGKQLRDTFLTNSCPSEVDIDKITVWWNNESLIQQIFIDLDKFWSSAGPGTPLGTQSSGTELDGENEDIDVEETVEIPKVQFDSNMEGTTITIMIEFDDGSTLTSDPFVPSF